MNISPCPGSRWQINAAPLAMILAASVAAAISWLPAGIGNVGKKSALLNGSFVRVTLPTGPPITHTIVFGQTPEQVRDILVARINSETTFLATVGTDPILADFQVTTASGGEILSLQIDENDTNIDDIGARFAMGKGLTTFKKMNSTGNTIVGNGMYILMVELWDNPDYSQTFNTAIAPNNTAAGLDASVKASLISAGFSVTETATSFVVSRAGDMIVSTQVDCTDSGVVSHDVLMQPTSPGPGGLPTLSDLGLFILTTLFVLAALAILRGRSV